MGQSTEQILKDFYQHFIIDLGGKKVPIPYRLNEINGNAGSAFQGKSSPEVIKETTEAVAKEQGFDLKNSSVEAIREFMKRNLLGIDCSGFAYRMLDNLLEKKGLGGMQKIGFDNVGRTNASTLTSDQFCIRINKAKLLKSGDLVKLNSNKTQKHCVLIIEVTPKKIVYAHSSDSSMRLGVHMAEIRITDPEQPIEKQDWDEPHLVKDWNEELDGAKRLRALD